MIWKRCCRQKNRHLVYRAYIGKDDTLANQIDKKANRMEESKAAKLWDKLNKMESTLEEKLKIFRVESNLPLRKLAEITGINKDKISRMTK